MDPAAVRAALERQQARLAPVARMLAAVAAFPPRLSADDWRGEAAQAAERLEERLRAELRGADRAAEAALRLTRVALADPLGVPSAGASPSRLPGVPR